MIDGRDLRIENWMNLTIGTPVPIQIGLMHFREFDSFTEVLEPIELSHEILVKLNANKIYEDKNLYEIGVLTFNFSAYGLCLWNNNSNSIVFGTRPFKYLHQLQNLYFDLTGVELQINF